MDRRPNVLHRNDDDDGMTRVAHHEPSADGVSWTASMDVTLRKITRTGVGPGGAGLTGPMTR
jgi:hypothetical protein